MRLFSFLRLLSDKSTHKFRGLPLIFMSLLLMTSCNDEIFIKETFFNEREFKIDGDGGSCQIKFQPKNLTGIGIEPTIGAKEINIDEFTVDTFDKNGDKIDNDSPINEIGWILYTSPDLMLSLTIDGKYLSVTSVEHTDIEYQKIAVAFSYKLAKEYVYITLTDGRPKEFVESRLDANQAIVSDNGWYSISERFTNKGDVPVTLTLKPYEHTNGTINFEPTDGWASNLDYFGSIPDIDNGKVIVKDMPPHTFCILSENNIYPMSEDQRNTEVNIKLNAGQTAEVRVKYADASLPFRATYINPVTQRTMTTFGRCTIDIPYTYEIQIKE